MAGCVSRTTGVEQSSVLGAHTIVLRDDVAPLSASPSAGGLPPHWESYIVTRNKRLTGYEQVIDENGVAVIKAAVDNSASGIAQKLDIPMYAGAKLKWRWKADELPLNADLRTKRGDDSPVRIALAFDGDTNKLTTQDHLHRELARMVSGRELPYATLMYVWGDDKFSKDEVVTNPYTGRIRAIVVERGTKHLGKWQTYVRDIVSDYEKAYGEAPGRLIGVAIMSDGDNTQSQFTAWYGDIELESDRIPTTTAAK